MHWLNMWLWWSQNTDSNADVISILLEMGHVVNKHILSEESLAQEPGETGMNSRLGHSEITMSVLFANVSTINPHDIIIQGELEGGLRIKDLD